MFLGGSDLAGIASRKQICKTTPTSMVSAFGVCRLQNAYEVSMPDPLSWLLQRAIPQLDR